jgi:glycosyltransferase involved in cell wall biosynthesis
MRILQLGRFWKLIGGVQMHAQALCQTLAAQGVEVVDLVAAPTLQSTDQTVDGYRMVEAACLGVYFSTAISPAMVLQARRLHQEKPFDLIHLHFPDPMSHLVSMCMPANVPRVITWHSDIVKQKNLLKLYRPFQRREIMRAQALIAPTAAHYSSSTQIPADYPAERRHIIPFGMNYNGLQLTPRIAERAAQIRSQAQGKLLVFTLGRHVSYKGFHVLIEAMQHTNAYLILGGDGPLTPELRQQVHTLGLTDKVQFTGRISDEDLPAYYHACDVFCLPSVTTAEAFGLVQLEAMACGKPVICTQLHNGVNAVNPHGVTGLTVPTHDAPALAHAMDALNDASLRQQLGQQAQAHALGNYSLQAMGEQHIQLYQDLLNTRS